MPRHRPEPPLTWIDVGQALPSPDLAWGAHSPAPGLVAASADLSAKRLVESYSQGIFPWYSSGQPVLWWSPDPRMVLRPKNFRFHRSLRQAIKRGLLQPNFSLCFDRDFQQVIERCSQTPRKGQSGTWIVPDMVKAYSALHDMGLAHSAELWMDGQLVAGLYFVALGHAVFGESMFTTVTDGSKMALALLVSVCLQHGIEAIDCQQNTQHLASLGASEIKRDAFVEHVQQVRGHPPVHWAGQTLYWDLLANLDNVT
ncbi:leucyl/phenylalanyl-tRNA--protein transferase [Limnohabitans sp. G3-2]|uniref:leucyl/phenylalanyl-tRNA--protein transferase n=1 Tax=Limnohabitans sp. G3-2 TaxID=1100711 RepID=UPI000C1F6B68|nr:leucyl/phenylalanyl-tRNA--protein transferase [Limnohabitans sp. G3-2]PIT77933.1 leucyl/phenylalanyl-tRNA--protein transferase [Limnohabitans sp. G3-2]